MDIRPIHTEADYKATLKEISALMESDPDLGTPEGDRLDILATLVQAYEAKHVPITPPDPVEAIKFRMDQSGLSVKDLEPIIGKSVSALLTTPLHSDARCGNECSLGVVRSATRENLGQRRISYSVDDRPICSLVRGRVRRTRPLSAVRH